VHVAVGLRADGCWIFRDGQHVGGSATIRGLLAAFEQVLYESLPGWHPPPRVILHAGAVAHQGEVFVLAGPSGAGKSSLTRALMACGAEYLTDELVITDGASLWGIPRALQFSLLGANEPCPFWLGDVDLETYRIERDDGSLSALPLAPVDPRRVSPGPYPAARARVVVLSRGAPDAVRRASAVEALAALHGGRFSALATDLGTLVGNHGPLALTWCSPEEAARLLLAAAHGTPVATYR
jgi:hypothetical protein